MLRNLHTGFGGDYYFILLKSLTNAFLLGREIRDGVLCFFGALLFVVGETKSRVSQ